MTDEPWILDLFAGAGGCSVGYRRAGFRVASSFLLMSPGCACGSESPYGVTGDGPEIRDYARNGRKARSVRHAQEVMGIDWMTTWDDLTDAIPPAYCEYIGGQLLEHLASQEVA